MSRQTVETFKTHPKSVRTKAKTPKRAKTPNKTNYRCSGPNSRCFALFSRCFNIFKVLQSKRTKHKNKIFKNLVQNRGFAAKTHKNTKIFKNFVQNSGFCGQNAQKTGIFGFLPKPSQNRQELKRTKKTHFSDFVHKTMRLQSKHGNKTKLSEILARTAVCGQSVQKQTEFSELRPQIAQNKSSRFRTDISMVFWPNHSSCTFFLELLSWVCDLRFLKHVGRNLDLCVES